MCRVSSYWGDCCWLPGSRRDWGRHRCWERRVLGGRNTGSRSPGYGHVPRAAGWWRGVGAAAWLRTCLGLIGCKGLPDLCSLHGGASFQQFMVQQDCVGHCRLRLESLMLKARKSRVRCRSMTRTVHCHAIHHHSYGIRDAAPASPRHPQSAGVECCHWQEEV